MSLSRSNPFRFESIWTRSSDRSGVRAIPASPIPDACLESILVPGDEIDRLRALDGLLGPLLEELGEVSDEAYLADPRWRAVVTLHAER